MSRSGGSCARTSSARAGTATGIAAPTSTTARRSARRRNAECQIDSIAQSWAVLSRRGDPSARAAGDGGARSRIWCDRDVGARSSCSTRRSTSRDLNPGYIKGYVPGVRENGGQYTHAAIWAVMAFAAAGRRRARVGAVPPDQSRSTTATAPAAIATLQGRAVRRRRRRLRGRAAHRPRRLDLVHRLGRLDVPPDHRIAARPAPGSRPTAHRAACPADGNRSKFTTAIAKRSITSTCAIWVAVVRSHVA